MILLPVQHREKIITLSKENLSRYGFTCFHSQGEVTVVDGLWHRTILLAAGTEGGNKNQIFKIHRNLLIEISSTDKIINSENYKIHAKRSDVEPIKLLSERAGWNQTKADLKAMIAKANCGYQLATYDHENREIPLGSGLSLSVADDMSWIGMILVHPELQRQGIARTIMNACLEQARLIQHKSIIGLDATPQGKQVYDSLGFKDSYKIWRSNISTDWEKSTECRCELRAFSSRFNQRIFEAKK